MYYLSQFARERVTVALSGDGGDELFGGYETYVADKYHRMLTQIVPRGVIKLIRRMFDSSFPVSFNKVSFDFKARRFLNGLLLPPERAHYSWRQYLSDDEKSACLNPDIAREVMLHDPFDVFKKHFAEVSSCHYLDQAMYVDMHTWLPNAILVKADRSSMANSLELRCPFLDHRLVQFAAALPIELKINIFNKKYILKRSQAAILPPSLLSRPKKGFNAPVANWLTTNLKDIFEQIVAGSTETNDILNKNFLTTLLEDHLERRRDNSFIIFNLIGLMQWLGNQRTGNRSATNLAAN
jgi:asparagine synthase (glutamine-hydrolysing)